MSRVTILPIALLGVALAAPCWAACEAEKAAMASAQKRMTAAVWALNIERSRGSAEFDHERVRFRDREDISMRRMEHENDMQYVAAQMERRRAWNYWREAKAGLDACSTPEKGLQ